MPSPSYSLDLIASDFLYIYTLNDTIWNLKIQNDVFIVENKKKMLLVYTQY